MSFLQRIPQKAKRTGRWKSPAHLSHVKKHACINCGSMTNLEAAHLRNGTDAGLGRKASDWFAVPLCGPNGDNPGCHRVQHQTGEQTFWANYVRAKGHAVWDVIAELIRTSPKRREIEEAKRERGL